MRCSRKDLFDKSIGSISAALSGPPQVGAPVNLFPEHRGRTENQA